MIREAAGLGRFAERMRSDGWTRERVLALPDAELGYWYAQSRVLEQTFATVHMEPGSTLLDVGANLCYASAEFAKRGCEVTALDISLHEMQGLHTADWQFEAKDVYFDRVLGVMFDLPFADASFDYIWCSEVLHHNHRRNLARTLRELRRVLKPGGEMIVANEPLRCLNMPYLNPGEEVAEFDGHEHAYMRFTYTTLARRAGFQVDVRGPWYLPLFAARDFRLSHRMTDRAVVKAAIGAIARHHPWLLKMALANRSYIRGGAGLYMICR